MLFLGVFKTITKTKRIIKEFQVHKFKLKLYQKKSVSQDYIIILFLVESVFPEKNHIVILCRYGSPFFVSSLNGFILKFALQHHEKSLLMFYLV